MASLHADPTHVLLVILEGRVYAAISLLVEHPVREDSVRVRRSHIARRGPPSRSVLNIDLHGPVGKHSFVDLGDRPLQEIVDSLTPVLIVVEVAAPSPSHPKELDNSVAPLVQPV